MATYITGDIHSNLVRLSMDSFPEQKEMTKDDFVIICGDFGLVWNHLGEDKYEKNWLDWLESNPFTTLFVDGNHENFDRLMAYPVEEWHGGKVHKIRPSVIHLMRGEVFNIDGKKILAYGGASSQDIQDGILDPDDFDDYKEFRNTWDQWDDEYRMFRVKGMSWWSQEMPSEEEMKNGIDNLEKHNWEVDYVISHCAPQYVASVFSHGLYKPDALTLYFNGLHDKGLKFKKWFFGHYHDNRKIMSKYIMLYEQIVRII